MNYMAYDRNKKVIFPVMYNKKCSLEHLEEILLYAESFIYLYLLIPHEIFYS